MKIKLDYSKAIDSITQGIMKYNRTDIIASLLMKDKISLYNIDIWDVSVENAVHLTAYNILKQLCNDFGFEIVGGNE